MVHPITRYRPSIQGVLRREQKNLLCSKCLLCIVAGDFSIYLLLHMDTSLNPNFDAGCSISSDFLDDWLFIMSQKNVNRLQFTCVHSVTLFITTYIFAESIILKHFSF